VLFLFLAVSASLATGPSAAAEGTRVEDFESGLREGIRSRAATFRLLRGGGDAAQEKACLEIRDQGGRGEASLTLPLPPGVNPAVHRALGLWFRSAPAPEGLRLRWLAQDTGGRTLFQRRFFYDGGDVWHRLSFPLSLWRWANDRVGDWSEVKAFTLVVETEEWQALRLDDVRLAPGRHGPRSALPDTSWLRGIAFGGEPCTTLSEGGFFLGTDAEGLSGEGLRLILGRIRKVPAWVDRVFGEAVRPVGGDKPVALLIFEKRRAYSAFFRRLGAAWRVNIKPPRSGGYTVHDIATSYFLARKGIDRPVYFHEAVHAVVARRLRLIPGSVGHSWLQEGIANYLQLCLFPSSLDRRTFVKNFSHPVDPEGKGFFKPLRTLLTERISTQHYAQLASLTAFLVERQPKRLGKIARGLADGLNGEKALTAAGTDAGTLQKEWFAWGRIRFDEGASPPDGPGTHFAVPAEWKKEKEEASGE
jgi:hypothetical protein